MWEYIHIGFKRIVDGVKQIMDGDFIGGIKNIFGGLLDIILAPFRAWYDAIAQFINDILEMFGLLEKEQEKSEARLAAERYNAGGGGYSQGGGGGGSKGGGGGGGSRAKGGIFYPSKLPRLAVGGIINQPGRGVPYHGAVIGERGAEAVIPLTDSQQMALLGETIGKYITINANITNTMNGRVISREIQRIQTGNDFVLNR